MELNSPGAEDCNSNQKPKQVKEKKENKRDMRFWRRVEACSLTLKSAAWQWTSSSCSDRHWQKNKNKKNKTTRHKLFKKHQDFSPKNTFTLHTIILLVSPTSSFVIFSFDTDNWTDIWTFLFFLIIVTLSISFYLCFHPFLLSSFSF